MTKNLPSSFAWYGAGVVSQFVPFGIHNVLYAWMIAVLLEETGFRLGFAQMCAQLPGLVLILFSGLLADRADRRKILVLFHCLACLPVFALAFGIGIGQFGYVSVVAFALLLGCFNTFLQPARDSLLNQVAGGDLQRAVTIVMGLSFGSQVIGYGLAAMADQVGPVPLLLFQGSLLVLGALVAMKLPRQEPLRSSPLPGDGPAENHQHARGVRKHLADIGDGLKLIFRSPRMAPVMILMFAVGIFYVGAFSVINPIVVRDVYDGGASDIALSYVCFMVGTIFTTVFLLSIGGIARQGLGLMIALVSGGLFLSLASQGLSFTGYLACIGMWGVCGGVAMSLGRSIVQESAPDSHRARALSVYSLGTLGGMPIGSILMGWAIGVFGPLTSFMVAVVGVLATVCVVFVTSDLKEVNRL